MEDRRRRRIAFENLAKGMLSYLDNCDNVKVGITELQEGGKVPLQFWYHHSAGGTAGDERKMARRFLKYSGKEKKKCALPVGPDGKRNEKA